MNKYAGAARPEALSQDKMALIEVPPSREQVRLAWAFVAVLTTALLANILYGATPLARIEAFIPIADAILLVLDLVAATLLFAQASVVGSRALVALASGYVFTGLMISAHALTFPGVFSPTGFLNPDLDTTVWIVFFWTAAFPSAALAYGLFKVIDAKTPRDMHLPPGTIRSSICASVMVAMALCAFAFVAPDVLPSFMVDPVSWNPVPVMAVYGIIAALNLAAMVIIWRQERSLLDMWLLVALFALMVQMVMDLAAGGRFTLAWYFSRTTGLLEHLLVVLVLLAEASRMYTRSALSVIALKRERESRLTSMHAVATAMAHEVRQPLTGIRLQASAALNWLDKPRPNRVAIAKSLTGIVEDTHRASNVAVSIRDVLAHESGEQTDFDLNELVRDTVARMKQEMSAQKIALDLSLHETLPAIRADRVQMQEVLVNLLTNAVDALKRTPVRRRKIAIRSSLSGHRNVLLEVSDSGAGVDAEQMDHMFDAFFTTKEHGTGMGLALCRSIVEAHGGQLWASPREESGITMHLQVPKSAAPVS